MTQKAKVCVMAVSDSLSSPQSYLEHVCGTHSYAFTPLHPCLYLAVSLSQRTQGLVLTQLFQDLHGDTFNTRGLVMFLLL